MKEVCRYCGKRIFLLDEDWYHVGGFGTYCYLTAHPLTGNETSAQPANRVAWITEEEE